VPLCLTLGAILRRLENEPDPTRQFAVLMPRTHGPCRFGVYHLLEKLILDRVGFSDRVQVWAPSDRRYFAGLGQGFNALAVSGLVAMDLLAQALCDTRPTESRRGAAEEIYRRSSAELLRQLEREGARGLSAPRMILEVVSGRFFGCIELLRQAAAEFAAVRGPQQLPTVAVVGEIYVRCDPFANDFIVDKLEQRGLRVRLAPITEWLEYVSDLGLTRGDAGLGDRISNRVQRRILDQSYATMAGPLGWPERATAAQALSAAAPYIRSELQGEAVLTLGGVLNEWRHGEIDGALSVGPLECMPNKIAEAQFFHTAEQEGLPSLTLALNGDPIDGTALDHFIYEVHERFRRRGQSGPPTGPRRSGRRLVLPVVDHEPALGGLSPGAAARSEL
jgi:predicted nucleotide-binding protein (sugar kinase/HSP70/actin superfamily)